MLETSHPPTYYLPRAAFGDGALRPAAGTTWCEWKGQASYFDLVSGTTVAPRAAWTYEQPTAGFEPIAGAIAVMAAQVDRCLVDGEVVTPQPGGFYGGWVTSAIVGPDQGDPWLHGLVSRPSGPPQTGLFRSPRGSQTHRPVMGSTGCDFILGNRATA